LAEAAKRICAEVSECPPGHDIGWGRDDTNQHKQSERGEGRQKLRRHGASPLFWMRHSTSRPFGALPRFIMLMSGFGALQYLRVSAQPPQRSEHDHGQTNIGGLARGLPT
jgi:hypothetical protein